MGIIRSLLLKVFPQHNSVVGELNGFSERERKLIGEVHESFKSEKIFNRTFQLDDATKISVDFKTGKLDLNIFPPDGTRIQGKTSGLYMGAVQWGGTLSFYNADGSFADGGVYPRKFNSVNDLFNYSITHLRKLQQNLSETTKKTLSKAKLDQLHKAPENELELVSKLIAKGEVVNPAQVAQEGALAKIEMSGGEQAVVKHLNNGRLIELGNGSTKIFLYHNNIEHFKLIEDLDKLINRSAYPYADDSELDKLFGEKGMRTSKVQPVYEADGRTLIPRKPARHAAQAHKLAA